MFFSDALLTSKQGELAATLGPRARRVTKKQLTSVNFAEICDRIAEPTEPMALRMSGALLVGVARVYNQNFELFYSDVNHFHYILRRSLVTDFAPTNGAGAGGTSGLDLPGGGKSNFNQITFGGIDYGWDANLSIDFGFIDWNNPLAFRQRRSSSKLGTPSQATQEKATQEEKENEDSEEGSEDEDDTEVGRARKKNRFTSSPVGAPVKDFTLPHKSGHRGSDATGANVYEEPDFRFDRSIDLGLNIPGILDTPGNASISAPSGRVLEVYDDGGAGGPDMGGDPFLIDGTPLGGPPTETRKRIRDRSEQDSIDKVDEAVQTPKKPKKMRMLEFDESLELSDHDYDNAIRNYAAVMARERKEIDAREQQKIIANQAAAMVDGAGGFFDPEMKAFFATITQAGKFKWELDVAANRIGKRWSPENLDDPKGRNGFEDPFGFDGQQGMQPMDSGYQEAYQDFEIPIDHRRQSEGEVEDVEQARRNSQGSQQGPLPWQDVSFGTDDHGPIDFADSSPGTLLRLSVQTPQENRIRSSHGQGESGTGRRVGRGRSRSGSILVGRAEDNAAMLVNDDDIELPDDQLELDSMPPSQVNRLAVLPAAFQPTTLATLEKQCRDFFSYVEKRMIDDGVDDLNLEDLAPLGKTKHVAALAFYNCLTLATKGIFAVSQPEPWGTISLRFTVQV